MAERRSVLDIPIFHKAYDLYKLLDSLHDSIPKSKRYTLWQRCENTTLALLEALIEAGHSRGDARLASLYIISDKIDLLKVLIRLAKETRTIDGKQYLKIQETLQEIGKMVGGWIKSVPTEFIKPSG